MNSVKAVFLLAGLALVLSGCSSLNSASSPDVRYDNNAESAKELQIPPDLTDVSNAEQFILPGIGGGPVARNTLLPQLSNVRFQRSGQQSWLAFDIAPEEVWPQLLAFAKKEKFLIDHTEPTTGLIVTQWRPASAVVKGNLLKNLIGGDEEFTRVAFRMERNGSGGRLFARSQGASEDIATASGNGDLVWPAESHDPEATSELLSRLLVFLGVTEQKARGIIDADQARMVTDEALVLVTGSGSQLLVQRGFQPAFSAILSALEVLDYSVSSSDDGVGRIEFLDGTTPLVIELTPQHVSEVRAALTDIDGRRLPAEKERSVLNALLENIV